MREFAGSKATASLPVANTVKVGVAPALMVVVTLADGGAKQAAVAGFVSQTERFNGNGVSLVSGVTVIVAPAPTFTDAMANAALPVLPGRFKIPSPDVVAPRATRSATGAAEAEKNNVFTPSITSACGVLAQSKPSDTAVGEKGAVGVRPNMNVCEPLGANVTSVFGTPVRAFVAGSVVWKKKLAGKLSNSAIPQPSIVALVVFSTVAKAVAVVPTCTDRLPGNTAAPGAPTSGLEELTSLTTTVTKLELLAVSVSLSPATKLLALVCMPTVFKTRSSVITAVLAAPMLPRVQLNWSAWALQVPLSLIHI